MGSPHVSPYQEDSDGLSAVSSYCDVRGGRVETSLCILSPDCELYVCEGDDDDDDSTDRWVNGKNKKKKKQNEIKDYMLNFK